MVWHVFFSFILFYFILLPSSAAYLALRRNLTTTSSRCMLHAACALLHVTLHVLWLLPARAWYDKGLLHVVFYFTPSLPSFSSPYQHSTPVLISNGCTLHGRTNPHCSRSGGREKTPPSRAIWNVLDKEKHTHTYKKRV